MKYSETTDDLRSEQVKYIDTRWKELSTLERKWIDSVLQYLFLTGSGAAVATLAFMGAAVQGKVDIPERIIVMLALFVGSVLLVGVVKAHQYYYTRAIYSNWRENITKFYADAMEWEHLNAEDAAVSKDSSFSQFTAWVSFFLIVAGVAIGFCALKEGIKYDKSEESGAAKTATLSATGAVSPPAKSRWAGDRNQGWGDRLDTGKPPPPSPAKEVADKRNEFIK